MIYIAHRGLFLGPDEKLENSPQQIELALKQGWACEIDLWVQDNTLWLGHDLPQYQVGLEFITQPGLWIHCKNFSALAYCQNYSQLNYFWHETDAYTMTSKGFLWVYPGKETNHRSIQVMPEMADPELKNINAKALGVCSDYVERIRSAQASLKN